MGVFSILKNAKKALKPGGLTKAEIMTKRIKETAARKKATREKRDATNKKSATTRAANKKKREEMAKPKPFKAGEGSKPESARNPTKGKRKTPTAEAPTKGSPTFKKQIKHKAKKPKTEDYAPFKAKSGSKPESARNPTKGSRKTTASKKPDEQKVQPAKKVVAEKKPQPAKKPEAKKKSPYYSKTKIERGKKPQGKLKGNRTKAALMAAAAALGSSTRDGGVTKSPTVTAPKKKAVKKVTKKVKPKAKAKPYTKGVLRDSEGKAVKSGDGSAVRTTYLDAKSKARKTLAELKEGRAKRKAKGTKATAAERTAIRARKKKALAALSGKSKAKKKKVDSWLGFAKGGLVKAKPKKAKRTTKLGKGYV